MQSVLCPVRSMSLILTLLRSFLTLNTSLDTFLSPNLIMVWPLFPIRCQSSMSSSIISTPALVIALHTTSSRSLSLTEGGMPVISRHSRLEYWTFALHCLCKAIYLSLRELFSILVTLKSDFNSSKFVFSFSTSLVRLLTLSFNLLSIISILSCRLTASATKSVLLSLFKDSSVSAAIVSYIVLNSIVNV